MLRRHLCTHVSSPGTGFRQKDISTQLTFRKKNGPQMVIAQSDPLANFTIKTSSVRLMSGRQTYIGKSIQEKLQHGEAMPIMCMSGTWDHESSPLMDLTVRTDLAKCLEHKDDKTTPHRWVKEVNLARQLSCHIRSRGENIHKIEYQSCKISLPDRYFLSLA